MRSEMPGWFRVIFWLSFVPVIVFIAAALRDLGADVLLGFLFLCLAPAFLVGFLCSVAVWVIYLGKWYSGHRRGDYSVSKPLGVVYVALALTAFVLPGYETVSYMQGRAQWEHERSQRYARITDEEALAFAEDAEKEDFEIVYSENDRLTCRPEASPNVIFDVYRTDRGILTGYHENYRIAAAERTLRQEQQAVMEGLDVDMFCYPLMTEPVGRQSAVSYHVFIGYQDEYDKKALYDALCEMAGLIDAKTSEVRLTFVSAEALEQRRDAEQCTPFERMDECCPPVRFWVILAAEEGTIETSYGAFSRQFDSTLSACSMWQGNRKARGLR